MSKANGAIEKKDTFLQYVSLKNYKSIKDVEIDFKPGLNIIIGKNASGKTNFVNGLNLVLNYNNNKLLDTESTISAWFEEDKVEVQKGKKQHINKQSQKKVHSDFSADRPILLKVNDEKVEVENNDDDFFDSFLYYFDPVLINYGIFYENSSPFIGLPTSFIIVNNGEISSGFVDVLASNNKTRFVNAYFNRFWEDIIISYWDDDSNSVIAQDWKKIICSFSDKWLKLINDLISLYTPIQALRLNPDFNLIKQDEGQKQTVTNFYLEFLIENNWLPFNLLSDGTKRLFYIISEILSWRTINDPIAKVDLNVILLEEPELGIHPHQLHQLMQFIREQSREKQIILTTHSPQVLDILGPDELDRVIICHSDPKNGTQLNHLTEKEINKAKRYMKQEAFLSDYWRFSDLEPAS